MLKIPTPIKAAIGLAATVVDEARKLPETLPQAATTVPMTVLSNAMQTSMRVQQRITELAVRGDDVLSHLRGTSAEPPTWATFDDVPAAATPAEKPKTAFDLIDYESTGFDEGDERPGRWDAVGVGGTQDDQPAPADAPTETPPDGATATDAPTVGSPAGSAASTPAPVKKPAKKAPAKKAAAKTATPDHEPLEVAAAKAKPSATPNPATMAAEILHAHDAEAAPE